MTRSFPAPAKIIPLIDIIKERGIESGDVDIRHYHVKDKNGGPDQTGYFLLSPFSMYICEVYTHPMLEKIVKECGDEYPSLRLTVEGAVIILEIWNRLEEKVVPNTKVYRIPLH